MKDISGEEVRTGLRKMKKGKALRPDHIPMEAWTALGNKDVEFLVNLFNELLLGEKMPDEWRRSVIVPLYKSKEGVKKCGNYRGIKLISHTMKLWEWVIKARIKKEVTIAEQQFRFMPERSTIDAIFCLRMLLEKWTKRQKAVHYTVIDLKNERRRLIFTYHCSVFGWSKFLTRSFYSSNTLVLYKCKLYSNVIISQTIDGCKKKAL